MTVKPFIPYAAQSIVASDLLAVTEALEQTLITRGPQVTAFEEAVAAYCGAKYAVAFNSGTSALMGAAFAAELGSHDRLLTTPNTFISSAGSAIQRGTTPVFIDIDRNTGNMRLDLLQYNVEVPHTRGKTCIMPVHFGGIAVDMQQLESFVTNPSTVIVEDAAHAIGSYYPSGERVGSCAYSAMTVFSFHPAKTITTGEGGMVTTNDPDLLERLRLFRDNGIERQVPDAPYPGYYEVYALTGNFHMTDFQAALGISQLSRIDQNIATRRALVTRYRERLKDVPHIRCFTDAFDAATAFHLFVVQIDFAAKNTTKGAVMAALKEQGIGTQVHYIPLYRHPYFSSLPETLPDYFPAMEGYYAEALTLPLHLKMDLNDVDRIVDSLL